MTRFVRRTVRTLVPCSCEPLVSAETPTVEHVNDYPCSTSALTAVRSEARGEFGLLTAKCLRADKPLKLLL